MQKALSDQALIAEGERTQRYVDYVDGDTTRAAVLKVVQATTPEQRQRIKDILAKAE